MSRTISALIVCTLAIAGMPAVGLAQPVLLSTAQTLATGNHDQVEILISGLFIGIVMTAAAYLFFIWIVMRDRGQVSLIFLLLCLGAYIASTNPLLMEPLGLHSMAARGLLADYSLNLSCIFSVLFTMYFLEVDVNCQEYRWPMFGIIGLLVVLLLYSVVDQTLAHFALPAVSALTISIVLACAATSFDRGIGGSLTHFVAFLFFLVGVLAKPLYDLGYIVSIDSVNNLTYISFSMASLMFAIVIATQFASRQEEKEKALAISNERFALATRGTNEGLFDWNLKSGEVFFSEQFRKIVGLRLENKPSSLKLWMRQIIPADRRVVRDAMRRFRYNTDVNIINIEYRVMSRDSTRHWLHSKAVAVRDPTTRKVTRLVGSTSDITSRKQSDVALRASEARFRSITEAHPVPVMIVSLNSGVVLYASPGAEELLGLTQDKMVHEPVKQFLPDENSWISITASLRRGQPVNLKEVQLRRNSGIMLATALSARRISYQDEDAMVIGLYDLTERKDAEAQIARQQEALQQSEKMAALGGLLAGVAHELNNPLSVIVGQSTLLIESAQEPKVVTRGEKIFKAADRCSRIVKSFLALARRKPPERKAVAINEVVHSALELLGYQMRTENVEVNLELEDHLPDINGDGDQLTQVVTNLVMNAIQAMQTVQGVRRLTVASRYGADQVVLSVSDTGSGIPPEIRSRIFEPFYTTKSNQGGTGVGLSLCLNIVDAHGGSISLEDTPGGGATFVVSLPYDAAANIADATEAMTQVTLPPGIKILIVDDEIELAQTLADLLEPQGAIIDIAINGAVAVEKLQKNTFDVIISDLRMPVMDGPSLYQELIRSFPTYLERIVYVTGDTLSTHVQAFLKEYPVPVIEKPYRLKDVCIAVLALLKKN